MSDFFVPEKEVKPGEPIIHTLFKGAGLFCSNILEFPGKKSRKKTDCTVRQTKETSL